MPAAKPRRLAGVAGGPLECVIRLQGCSKKEVMEYCRRTRLRNERRTLLRLLALAEGVLPMGELAGAGLLVTPREGGAVVAVGTPRPKGAGAVDAGSPVWLGFDEVRRPEPFRRGRPAAVGS